MATTRQLIYYILDLLKLSSDDSTINERHVLFSLQKFRTYLLDLQLLKDPTRANVSTNLLTICIDLQLTLAFDDDVCGNTTYLKSTLEIPSTLNSITPTVSLSDYFSSFFLSFVSKERMRVVGWNKYLKNFVYCAIGTDRHLYLKSANTDFLSLELIRISGVFEDFESAAKLDCNKGGALDSNSCDPWDKPFPIEEDLIPQLIEMVMKELAGPSWKPSDNNNNAMDDLANLASYIAKNTKSDLQKKMTGDE